MLTQYNNSHNLNKVYKKKNSMAHLSVVGFRLNHVCDQM